jgi:O-antigen/teichoic acid export membrane protein
LFKSISHNFLLNVASQGLVGIFGLFLLPLFFNYLGDSDFGLYSIILVVFNTAVLLDFGIGKSVTFNIANNITDKSYATSVVLFSFTITFFLSLLLVLIYFAISNFYEFNFINVLISRNLYLFIPLSFPIILISGLVKSVLEGYNEIKYSIFLKFFLNISLFIIPALGVFFSLGINSILYYILIFRILIILPFLTVLLRRMNFDLHNKSSFNKRAFLKFAGWTSTSNILTPVIVQFDKFLIVEFLGISLLGYYTLPLELINGFLILPSALSSVIFPKFCSGIINLSEKIVILNKSLKYLLICIIPIFFLATFFSLEILSFWQNNVFAIKAKNIFPILLLGSIIFSFGWFLSNFLIGNGRADIPSRVFSVEIPFYFLIAYFLTKKFNLVGISIAFLLRSIIQVGLYVYFLFKIHKINLLKILYLDKIHILILVLLVGTVLFKLIVINKILFGSVIFLTLIYVGFYLVLEKTELDALKKFIKK